VRWDDRIDSYREDEEILLRHNEGGYITHEGCDHIFFVGFLGAGKSTLARNLGKLYRRTYVDTDRMAERLMRKTVRECFEQDGEEAFRAAVKRMKDAGAFVQVYTNGMLWDCGDKRWNGDDEVVVEANGKNKVVVYNHFTKSREAHMCGEAPKFQGLMRKLEKTLAGTGLDGVYMDMISCATQGGRCFNPHHKHAPGGGTHRIDGYRDYVGKVRKDNPGFLLSSEATSEAYVDLFDAFIVIYSSWERTFSGLLPVSEPVPAVSVIYRGAAVPFGSFATPSGLPPWDPKWGKSQDVPDVEKIVAKFPDQFVVEFARGIIWGIQPLVHNFTMKDVANPRLKDDIQFMKDATKFYFIKP
jgi:hypothetical protein